MYRPTTLQELQEYLDLDRDKFYLDGPNGVDWIFQNEVVDGREGAFYVDYVRHDDGDRWTDPTEFEELSFGAIEPASVKMARFLHAVGMTTPEALATVAQLWRESPVQPDTHCTQILAMNRRTLELLQSRDQLVEQPEGVFRHIADNWQFPMYGLDLSMIKINQEILRERQRNWNPDGDW